MPQIIALICKPHHPRSKEVMTQALALLKKYDVSLIIEEETYASLRPLFANDKTTLNKNIKSCPRHLLISSSDLVIIYGGDGTLISVCRHARCGKDKFAKVLGVNLGNLGFLTEIKPEEIETALDNYFSDLTKTSIAPLLQIEVEQEGTHSFFALNDVVINKQALARIFMLGLTVNGEHAANIRGDGVIISTPNGSTAYSLAAGGSIVHPDVDALLITPICPHSLSSRPIVIPGNAEVILDLGLDSRAQEVYLTIDGQEGLALRQGTQVTIRKSSNYVEFLRLPNSQYFANLSNKLRWG